MVIAVLLINTSNTDRIEAELALDPDSYALKQQLENVRKFIHNIRSGPPASTETQKEEMNNTEQLEKLLSVHPNIVFQKFAGNREYPYEIRLGSLNFWAKGEAIENALKIDPKTIKGVAR
jgi:hypothetical protein